MSACNHIPLVIEQHDSKGVTRHTVKMSPAGHELYYEDASVIKNIRETLFPEFTDTRFEIKLRGDHISPTSTELVHESPVRFREHITQEVCGNI